MANLETMVPTMLTIQQTAQKTGIAAYRIRQMVLNNEIPFVKAGCKYLVNLEKFIDFLNGGSKNER